MSGYAEMQIIAVEVANSRHGDFLKHMANAWLKADPANRGILEQAWRDLIAKYSLDEEYAAEIEAHRDEYAVRVNL